MASKIEVLQINLHSPCKNNNKKKLKFGVIKYLRGYTVAKCRIKESFRGLTSTEQLFCLFSDHFPSFHSAASSFHFFNLYAKNYVSSEPIQTG